LKVFAFISANDNEKLQRAHFPHNNVLKFSQKSAEQAATKVDRLL
jgi:hypothetical protein